VQRPQFQPVRRRLLIPPTPTASSTPMTAITFPAVNARPTSVAHPSFMAMATCTVSITSITYTIIRCTLATALVRSAGTGSLVMEGLRSVAMAVSGVAKRAEPMRFSHADPDKESFVDAVAATHLKRTGMEPTMWLKTLHWLLERLVPDAEEPQVAPQHWDELELQKAEAAPCLYPPTY
jgi:hypothetical protein